MKGYRIFFFISISCFQLQSCSTSKGLLNKQKVNFINVEEVMQKVALGNRGIENLGLGAAWILYLDTSYYDLLSKFSEFDQEINKRSDLPLYSVVEYDTVSCDKAFKSVEKLIIKSKRLKEFVKSDTGLEYNLDMFLAMWHNNKALFRSNCTYYRVELIDQNRFGIEAISWCYYD